MPFNPLDAITGLATGGALTSNPSGIVDTGPTSNSSSNVLNFAGGNLGEIIQAMNAGSTVNGGFPASPPSLFGNGGPSTGLSIGLSAGEAGGAGLNLGFGGFAGIALLGLGGFLLLRNRF